MQGDETPGRVSKKVLRANARQLRRATACKPNIRRVQLRQSLISKKKLARILRRRR